MPALEVEKPLIVDAPSDQLAPAPTTPETTFEQYVARRQQIPAEPAEEPEEAAETSEAPVAPPETPASEAAPAPPAETVKPPEPATASEPVESQEVKAEREKQQGIPQSRLDEVTRARRDAERERDAEKARATALEAELAELRKPKAAEPPPPQTETKPVEAKPKPTVDQFEAYEEFIEALTDWKADERDRKQAEARTAADAAKQAEADKKTKAEAATTADATAEARLKQRQERFDAEVAEFRGTHSDYDEAILYRHTEPVNNPAMVTAVQEMPRGKAVAAQYWLAKHPKEAARIQKATAISDFNDQFEVTEKLALATYEITQAILSDSKPLAAAASAEVATPPAPVVAEPVAAVPVPPVQPAPPENQKPAVSKAPPPPAPVTPMGSPTRDPKTATTFEEYEARRRPQLRK
jgi:hypothetical protein